MQYKLQEMSIGSGGGAPPIYIYDRDPEQERLKIIEAMKEPGRTIFVKGGTDSGNVTSVMMLPCDFTFYSGDVTNTTIFHSIDNQSLSLEFKTPEEKLIFKQYIGLV